MLIPYVSKPVKANRKSDLNKKSLRPDHLPIISPALISRAARIARIRARHRVHLDILTLFNLMDFHLQCKQASDYLSKTPLENGYVIGVIHGRIGMAIPATYYFETTRNSLWRLEVLRDYHQSHLSPQATMIINQTIEQHRAKLQDMLMRSEGLAALEMR
jgi:hypothetical protein